MKFNAAWWTSAVVVASIVSANAQEKAPDNWFNLDQNSGKVSGLGTEKAYQDLLKDMKPTRVIVGVLDSGVEVDHEDLKGKVWVNEKEIPNNGKDDDGNGYIDDVNGWNFLGGKGGKSVLHETLEMTRLYGELKPKYDGKKAEDMKGKADKAAFALWERVKKEYEAEQTETTATLTMVEGLLKSETELFAKAKKKLGVEKLTKEILATIADDDTELGGDNKKKLLKIVGSTGEEARIKRLKDGVVSLNDKIKFQLDPKNSIRKDVIGDDPNDLSNRFYGNNDVEGPDASHGTHVSGIIAANRNNTLGMKGVCNDCVIMSVRCVPDGDEADKDVANAIRYAVDNGALVLNMSFGKAYPKHKKYVDEALKYAAKKDVLLVHAAGNESLNKDETLNYPNRYFDDNRKCEGKNWLDIGAMTWHNDEHLPASFSNYGKKTVDVFAPGFEIYSTIPDGKYASFSGTSMAAPTVAGAAGLLLTYFPTLSSEQVKEIIMKSAHKNDTEVLVPGEDAKKVKFSDLSITGATVDLYEAIKLAKTYKGKRKMKK
ncbi:MAG: hypothetical protein RI894_1350 [Bacteroidota bacterium]|jgi:subtilisin family serine protease